MSVELLKVGLRWKPSNTALQEQGKINIAKVLF